MIPHFDRASTYPGEFLVEDVPERPGVKKITRADVPSQLGTAQNKALFDEFLAASGTCGGAPTALTLAQTNFQLFDGALVRARVLMNIRGGATLNVQATGAKPLIDGSLSGAFVEAGSWISAVYSSGLDAWIVQGGQERMVKLFDTVTSSALTQVNLNISAFDEMNKFSQLILNAGILSPSLTSGFVRVNDISSGRYSVITDTAVSTATALANWIAVPAGGERGAVNSYTITLSPISTQYRAIVCDALYYAGYSYVSGGNSGGSRDGAITLASNTEPFSAINLVSSTPGGIGAGSRILLYGVRR